ncbi:MAG: fructose-bisphosphatase class III [Stomatobaculum sp.]|nr:fructose-bisphosphatase class III [Stomatobaculum sp.]
MHYVCSDIHGQIGLYKEMLAAIDLKPEDTLYVLGDVIDRGPGSMEVLKDVMERENAEFFLGNHEFMMLNYFETGGNYTNWTIPGNGGKVTRDQFLELPEEEQERIISFLKNAWIQKYVEVQGVKYALHHSFFLPEKTGQDVRFSEEPDRDAVTYAVWYSLWRMWERVGIEDYDDGYMHILGHVPVMFTRKNGPEKPPLEVGPVINIDGGCAAVSRTGDGGLFCMSLETDEKGKRKEFWFPGKKKGILGWLGF